MNSSVDRRALEILDEVYDLPASDVVSFLNSVCGSDAALRKRVEQLIGKMKNSGGVLSETPLPEIVTSRRSRVAIGDVLAGRYTIGEVVGSGGMGDVYRANDTRLGRDVAVKLLNAASSHHPEMQERFRREMRSVAALSDPHIVTLHDIADHGEMQFAVMEFVEGKTLREVANEGLDARAAIVIFQDIASGLEAAHRIDVMHRDIKPENIIVTPSHRAKILDFGLARSQEPNGEQRLTVTSMTPGTIPYMSPEQAEGKELSCATDIFSFGTVMFEVLAGTHPFRGDTALETMRRIADARPPRMTEFNSDVPTGLETLVAGMMDLEPSNRPTATEINKELSSVAADFPSNLTTPSIASSKSTRVAKTKPRSQRRWQPSLAVLPFEAFGDDQELAVVADGVAENLTTVLTRVPMLSLTSRSSSFSLKGRSPTAEEVRRRFGVDYMIEGSLQQLDDFVRANVQLIQTETGFHLWAQQFDCRVVGSEVEQLVTEILTRLEPQLSRAIFNDLGDDTGEWNSRQLLIRAVNHLSLKGWHRDSFAEVVDLLRKSIELEPDYALSHAHLALTQGLAMRVGLTADPEESSKEAVEHAEIAMDLDELDSNVIGMSGCALSDIGQIPRAIPLIEQAIELNPLNAQAHAALGTTCLSTEDYAGAVECLKKGIELSPADGRLAVWYASLAIAYLYLKDNESALAAAESGCRSDRKTYLPRVVRAAVHIVREEESLAVEAIKEATRVKPDLSKDEITRLVGRPFGIAIRKLMRSIP